MISLGLEPWTFMRKEYVLATTLRNSCHFMLEQRNLTPETYLVPRCPVSMLTKLTSSQNITLQEIIFHSTSFNFSFKYNLNKINLSDDETFNNTGVFSSENYNTKWYYNGRIYINYLILKIVLSNVKCWLCGQDTRTMKVLF